jgi:GT2 family glycosyltransferase
MMTDIDRMPDAMPDVSIAMVSLNCWGVLKDCLDSLRASDPSVTHELFLVDNGSTDGTRENARTQYPEATLIENSENAGFLKGTNQGIRLGRGRYVLWLNPDTILRPDSLRQMVGFLEAHPKAGIVGPRVLNADGSFQPQCKRGMPTPGASLAYYAKLDRLFPRNHTLGQYLLRYLPEDQANQVDAVSGCCLMARREVVDDIGLLDEDLKQWGEDIEWCVRAKKADWEVWYNPESVITHLKGKGGRHAVPYHVTKNMHYAMWVFYRKYFQAQSSPLTSAAVWTGIQGSLAGSLVRIWTARNVLSRPPAVRFGLLAGAVLLGFWVRQLTKKDGSNYGE